MTKINSHTKAAALWLEYKNVLQFYIQKKVGDRELSEDLSHAVLMKVYNSCCSGTEIKNVRSWMFQIAHNAIMDFFRKQQKETHAVPELSEMDEPNNFAEMAELLHPLIDLLPEKYAVPLRLSDIEELKQSEVAQKLGLSLTATKSRIQRARKLLKDQVIECSELEMDASGKLISLDPKVDCETLKKPGPEKKR